MKVAFDWKFLGKGRIKTCVNKIARGRKKKSPHDVIHVMMRSSDGEYALDADITPQEAVYLANALLAAYTMWSSNNEVKHE